jgi:hypothetical protein
MGPPEVPLQLFVLIKDGSPAEKDPLFLCRASRSLVKFLKGALKSFLDYFSA